MIKATCWTNLDKYSRCNWPTVFAAVPNKGDGVESMDRQSKLCVVEITHAEEEGKPKILIELSTRKY